MHNLGICGWEVSAGAIVLAGTVGEEEAERIDYLWPIHIIWNECQRQEDGEAGLCWQWGGGAAPGQNILGWLWTDVIAENPPAEQTQGEPEEEVGEKWEGEREAKRVWQDRRERGAEREEEK